MHLHDVIGHFYLHNNIILFVSEFKKSDHDHQFVGRTGNIYFYNYYNNYMYL